MKSPFPAEAGPTPAKLCASYDLGGGVRLADSFAIYSIVALPPDWTNLKIDPETLAELERVALVVANKLPILTTLRDSLVPDLSALPRPPRPRSQNNGHTHPCDHLPWFLINAARYSQHCVLGHNDCLESLLMVSQRPWCILELCCCETSTVAAVHELVMVATKLDYATYSPALRLLAHEVSQRQDRRRGDLGSCDFTGALRQGISDTAWEDAFIMYKELSKSCLRSHNSFWIGLISTCAVYLGLAFSDLVQVLGDLFNSPLTVTPEVSSAIKPKFDTRPPRSSALIDPSTHVARRTEKLIRLRRNSIDVIPHPKSYWHIGNNPTFLGQNFSADVPPVRDLLNLYGEILRGFRENL
ncbi:uncharacterized protein N7482_001643 [Penicillium canariense]|uniref:Uncharacterized protein n=1 Tax=Penicillium canariense TaxID=189055 RepID=A0A9W9IK47_9EURO|nr:uncharacterized protein N7482_001643 [Penicillium canariense]KAJ5175766.1 hypothetical protein N7482_001643 [Penicillium canariense]